jgi:hypothetical protein
VSADSVALITILFAMLHVSMVEAAMPGGIAKIPRAALNQILDKSVVSFISNIDPNKAHLPWLFCIDKRAGGNDPLLSKELENIGVQGVDEHWISKATHPNQFCYVGILDVNELARNRVRVYGFVCANFVPGELSHITGTLILDKRNHGWFIDINKSAIWPQY